MSERPLVDAPSVSQKPLSKFARKSDALWIAAFSLVGLCLRIPLLGRGMWRDEGSTYTDISSGSLATVLHHVWTNEMTPPLYFVLEYLWMHLTGASEAALRVPSLFFGVATIAVMYVLGRKAAGATGALVCAFCMTFAPLAIELDAEARAYSLGMLLCATLLYAVVSCMSPGRISIRWICLLVVSSILLAGEYGTGFVVIAVVAVWATAGFALRPSAARGARAAGAVASAIAALAFVAFTAHAMQDWHGCCDRYDTLYARINDGLDAFSPFGAMQYHTDTILQVAVAVWIGGLFFRKHDRLDGVIALTSAIVAIGVGVGIAKNVSPERHLMIYAPAAWLLMATLCARFGMWLGRAPSARWIALAPLAYVLVAALLAYPRAYAYTMQPISGMRDAIAALAPELDRPLLVLAAPDTLGPSLYYYARGKSSIMLRGIVTWEHPESYLLDPAPWYAPGFVDNELRRIDALAREKHATIAIVAKTGSGWWYDGMPLWRAGTVAARLESEHGVLYRRTFPGTFEPVVLTVLR